MGYKNVDEQKAYQREWYEARKAAYRKRSAERYQLRKAWLALFFKDIFCIVCRESCQHCIDLHHLDPSLKEGTIAQLYRNGASKMRVIAEMQKCVALCSNCHRKLHADLLCLLSPETIIVPPSVVGAWVA